MELIDGELVCRHRRDGARGQDPSGRRLAPPAQHGGEPGEVVDGRDESAAAAREGRFGAPLTIRGVVDRSLAVGRGAAEDRPESITGAGGDRERGVDHPEWIEDAVAEHLGERRAGGPSDEHAEDVGAGVIEPPLTRLVLERERAEPTDPLVGRRRCGRHGRAGAEREFGHRLEDRLWPGVAEIHTPTESKREHVVDRDRSLGGHRVVEWAGRPNGSTRRSASSGSQRSIGASSARAPSSTSVKATAAVIGFVIDEMR